MDNGIINPSRQTNSISRRINILYNSMIIVSLLMIASSAMAAIGVVVWLHNFSAASGGREPAYSIGARASVIGGILVIVLGVISISLFIYRIILQRRLKNDTPYPAKRIISLILFVISMLPPIIVISIEIFRFL